MVGFLFSLLAVLAITAWNLTTRYLQDVHHMIIQIPYNGFSAVLFVSMIGWQWAFSGIVPLAKLTDSRAYMILLVSAVSNFLAQVAVIIAY
jgi:hypothetical protein